MDTPISNAVFKPSPTASAGRRTVWMGPPEHHPCFTRTLHRATWMLHMFMLPSQRDTSGTMDGITAVNSSWVTVAEFP